jgi:hypothetical protein
VRTLESDQAVLDIPSGGTLQSSAAQSVLPFNDLFAFLLKVCDVSCYWNVKGMNLLSDKFYFLKLLVLAV